MGEYIGRIIIWNTESSIKIIKTIRRERRNGRTMGHI